MKKNTETLHLHNKKAGHGLSIFLLFIPAIVFAVISAFAFKNLTKIKDSGVSAVDGIIPKLSEKTIKIGEKEIKALIADNDETRKTGLGGRDTLEADKGMLFVFDKEDTHPPFWMKDMHFPLDIIWINDGKIIHINENIEPATSEEDLKFYLPPEPVDYVLEVNAGFSRSNNLNIGDNLTISD